LVLKGLLDPLDHEVQLVELEQLVLRDLKVIVVLLAQLEIQDQLV